MSDEPEIRVQDKRRFTADGEPIEAAEPEEAAAEPETEAAEAAPPEPEASAPEAEAPPEQPAAGSEQAFQPPPASLELLVYSLVMQAEMSLMGEGDGQPPNIPMARHAIDMLGVLKDKTKGNLSMEEGRLLENSLTELRFRFVQRQEELKGGAA